MHFFFFFMGIITIHWPSLSQQIYFKKRLEKLYVNFCEIIGTFSIEIYRCVYMHVSGIIIVCLDQFSEMNNTHVISIKIKK